MPTYDYQCRSCGHTVEVVHPMSEDGPTTCEVCGGPLRRVLYPTGIIFKGSGFYKTDSRSSSGSSSSHARKDGAAATDAATPSADKGSTDAPAAAGGSADKAAAKPKSKPASSGNESKAS
jgi:putative FmdB family regulatory protein